MEENDSIHIHNEQANKYDQQVKDYKWFGHDVLFGMCFGYINPDERLLDVGIGTGLCSQAFAKVGLEIFGIDGSSEMLNICKSKGFAKELKQFDLRSGPLPYSDNFFHHVVCSGVFHFFGELEPLFKEIARVTKPEGTFAFNTLLWEPAIGEKDEGYLKRSAHGGMAFMHSDRYIQEICLKHSFNRLKELKFFAWSGRENEDFPCEAYLFQRS